MTDSEADETEELEVLILDTDTPDINVLNMTKPEIDKRLREVMNNRRDYDCYPGRKYN
jgi:hypothetical protein